MAVYSTGFYVIIYVFDFYGLQDALKMRIGYKEDN